MVAAKLSTLAVGSNQHASIEAPSQEDAANMLNVARSSVQRAAKVRNEGTPELIQAVERGVLPVSSAAQIAAAPATAQHALIADAPSGKA